MTAVVTALGAALAGVWEYLRAGWASADLTAWREFWLLQVLDDRLWVVWCLPLVLVLTVLPQRMLRGGIVATGLLFIGVMFGAFYLAVWLGLCVFLYWLSERLAVEFRRTDVLAIGPPLAGWLIIGGGYFASFFIPALGLDPAVNRWVFDHVPWALPLGLGAYLLDDASREQAAALASQGPGALSVFLFHFAHLVGTAYLAVRMLQYLSDIKSGQIAPEQRSFGRFMAFVCYAPTLMQGPIERYNRFHEQIDGCVARRRLSDWPIGLGRIGWGVGKAALSTIYLFPVVRPWLLEGSRAPYYAHPEQIESYAFLYFGVYLHIFWLYVEFSAYCDIAIGASRLLGYRCVENFNWPWLATSIRDFWRRWHISLSAILRDYIYIPLGGNRRHQTLNLCITFALIGVWHGPLLQLAAWGVVMGLLVAVNQRWAQWVRRLDEREAGLLVAVRRAVARTRPLPQIVGWALTMHVFCHSLLIFFGGTAVNRVYWELIRRAMGW